MSAHSRRNELSALDFALETTDRAFLSKFQGNPSYFGDPDGARADLRDFVDLEGVTTRSLRRPWSATIRTVIGPKGSGKTLYLRRMAANLRNNPSLVLSEAKSIVVNESPPTRLLTSEHVIKVAILFPEYLVTEMWQLLWGRAIVSAAATHLIFNREMRAHIDAQDADELLSNFAHCIGKRVAAARSPLTTLKALIDRFDKAEGLKKFLNDPLWDDLEERVTELLSNCPPLVFVIDSIDDDFAHAPSYWARCQKGLFYESMRLLRSRGIGARLLVLISLRDVVYHAVFRSEHASRYVGDPHLKLLDWGYNSARSLLDAKTSRISSDVLGTANSADFRSWLGFGEVANSYGASESVYHYALRHTQCQPRDIVNLGNLVGHARDNAKAEGREFRPTDFRQAISDIATLSGHVQVVVAANQVIADEIPAEAIHYGFTDTYLAIDEYRLDRVDAIKGIISRCGSLRFGKQKFNELQYAGRDLFGAPDLASVLWQCGLLGYQDPNDFGAVFFSLDRLGRLRIPGDKDEYVLHSSMHEVAHVAMGDRPVVPWGFPNSSAP